MYRRRVSKRYVKRKNNGRRILRAIRSYKKSSGLRRRKWISKKNRAGKQVAYKRVISCIRDVKITNSSLGTDNCGITIRYRIGTSPALTNPEVITFGATTAGSYDYYAFDEVNEFNSFTKLYDQVKLSKVVLKFIPYAENGLGFYDTDYQGQPLGQVVNQYFSAPQSMAFPVVHAKIMDDVDNTLAQWSFDQSGEIQALQHYTAKVRDFKKPQTIVTVPRSTKAMMTTEGGVAVSQRMVKCPWMDLDGTATPNNILYGDYFNLRIPATMNSVDTIGEGTSRVIGKMYAKFYLKFRGTM